MKVQLHLHDAVGDAVARGRATLAALPIVEFCPRTSLTPNIPPFPHLYFGRASETEAVVDRLVGQDSRPAYVAVLGGPGIGKTSLAAAALHSPAVVARFAARRYFVSCDTIADQTTVMSALCGAFGIVASTRRRAETALSRVLAGAPSLLILDNFETAWEADASRQDAEATLAFLGEIDGLSLIVTLRGSERPNGIAWTKPFPPVLLPLDDSAARQTLAAVADVFDGDPRVDELLSCVGNLPLALVLVGTLAQFESLQSLLARFSEVRTAMLKRDVGEHRLNSVDVSISLSLQSPRVQRVPSSVAILSLLSMLPQGVMYSDYRLWAAALPDSERALSALLQTSLVYRTHNNRLHVLPPVRHFMLVQHEPSDVIVHHLYTHYFRLAESLVSGLLDPSNADTVSAVCTEVDNIGFVVRYALQHAPEPRSAVSAAVRIVALFYETGLGSFDLAAVALGAARTAQLDDLVAELLYMWALVSFTYGVAGDPRSLWQEALPLFEKMGNTARVIDATSFVATYLPSEQAVDACNNARRLAEEMGDARRLARSLQRLGFAYTRMGRHTDAREALRQAIDVLRSLGTEPRLFASMLYHSASLDADACDAPSAITRLQEAVAIFDAVRDAANAVHTRTFLARLRLLQGDTASVLQELERALREVRATGNVLGEFEALIVVVNVQLMRGDEVAAAQALQRAEALIRSPGATARARDRPRLLQARGELEMACGDLIAARTSLHGALEASRSRNLAESPEFMLQTEAEALDALGRVEEADGCAAQALICFVVAALVHRKHACQYRLVPVLTRLALVLEDQDADAVLLAVLPPLHRLRFRPVLAETLLCSADISRRRGQDCAARLRAGRALEYFEETGILVGCQRARDVLDI